MLSGPSNVVLKSDTTCVAAPRSLACQTTRRAAQVAGGTRMGYSPGRVDTTRTPPLARGRGGGRRGVFRLLSSGALVLSVSLSHNLSVLTHDRRAVARLLRAAPLVLGQAATGLHLRWRELVPGGEHLAEEDRRIMELLQ
jgi:hypothetical protein